ncbi:guanylate kinase [Actinomadura algeriensis]|uniref:Guanylate kinase n=1 Tax=Actinomadura algeriensis TaxID=1679523 RepID=A0ABR9JM21_9ACTN|nr:guanylate kinase [Actinomadura algeriensis]MBE1531604.1 guanylate kinase [Actinomadura algeriensis]
MRRGVILCGPSAVGKATVAGELFGLDGRFVRVPEVAPGELDELRAAGRIAVEIRWGDEVFAVDRRDMDAVGDAGRVPIARVVDVVDLQRLKYAVPFFGWTSVLLWAPREVCGLRAQRRGDADAMGVLRMWDETRRGLLALEDPVFNLVVHTDRVDPGEAARRVVEAVDAGPAQTVSVVGDVG